MFHHGKLVFTFWLCFPLIKNKGNSLWKHLIMYGKWIIFWAKQVRRIQFFPGGYAFPNIWCCSPLAPAFVSLCKIGGLRWCLMAACAQGQRTAKIGIIMFQIRVGLWSTAEDKTFIRWTNTVPVMMEDVHIMNWFDVRPELASTLNSHQPHRTTTTTESPSSPPSESTGTPTLQS